MKVFNNGSQYIFDEHLITVVSDLSGMDLNILKKILGLSTPGLYLDLLGKCSYLCLCFDSFGLQISILT